MNIASWLRELGLERYEQAFQEADIDSETLPDLTGADLKELGIPLGPRKKLLKAIAVLAAGVAPATIRPAAEIGAAEVVAIPTLPEAERRQLTVMFCDLVGSTQLSTRLDPEDMAQVIGAYQSRCAEVVERWGGHVARYLGDGILAYFGYPEAHENDAERAVRCALELTIAVARIEANGMPLAARIGIATGLVMVGMLTGEGARQKETVVGETPNLAARLQALAEPGRVLLSLGTRHLVGRLFDLDDLGEHDLKGFAEPVPAWQVLGQSRTEGRFEALHGARLTPMVGREEELHLLLSCWRRARGGEGQVVLLSGEPGIGKSRIVETLRSQLTEEPHVNLRYFCSPFHVSSALYPVLAQLQRAAGFERDDSDAIRLDKLEALLGQGAAPPTEAAALLAEAMAIPTSELYPPLKLNPQRRKQRAFEVLLEQLERFAAQQAVLLVLEDAHWVDPTTRELFDLVVERMVRLPVLLVVTFRAELDPPWTDYAHVTQLPLSRLSFQQSEAIVARLTSGKALPAEVLEQIVGRTDGVPLFVEELTKTVLESGLLTDATDRFELAGPLPPLAIPATLHDSLMARLGRLAHVKEVAQIGAVIGREFSHELIAAVIDRPAAELTAALGQLAVSELIFHRGAPPDATYRFKHALVQDVAYQSLLKSKRRRLHGRVAAVLLERFPETTETAPEVLAHHYSEAQLAAPAITHWRAAAGSAAARSANAEAADHLASALRLLPALPEGERDSEELDLQLMLGFVLLASRGFGAEEVGGCYWRAVALCEALGERQKGLVARFGLWRFHLVRGEFRIANQLALELKQAAEEDGSAEIRVISDWAYGVVSFWLGRIGEAKAHLERAAAHCPEHQRDLAARYAATPGVTTRLFLSWTLWLLGEPKAAVATMAEALALAEPASHAHSRAWTAVQAAILHQFLGDVGATRRYAQIAIDACDQQRIPHFRAQAEFLSGWARSVSGERDTGIAEMERALEHLQMLGNRPMLPYFLALKSEVMASEGRTDEALSAIEAALAESAVSEQSWCNAELHRVRGAILSRSDAAGVSAAETELKVACELAHNQGALAWKLRAAISLADLWMRCGRSEEARALLAPLAGRGDDDECHSGDLDAARALLSRLDENDAERFGSPGASAPE